MPVGIKVPQPLKSEVRVPEGSQKGRGGVSIFTINDQKYSMSESHWNFWWWLNGIGREGDSKGYAMSTIKGDKGILV